MAVRRSDEDIPALSDTPLGLACSVCEKDMYNLNDCCTTKCNHTFHKNCLTEWLVNSKDCPNCKKLCHEKDLIIPGSKVIPKTKPNIRNRGRGSAVKYYSTRNTDKRFEGEANASQSTQFNFPNNPNRSPIPVSDQPLLDINSNNSPTHNPNYNTPPRAPTPNNTRQFNLNYNQVTDLIETSIQRALSNLNIQSPQHNVSHNSNRNFHSNGRSQRASNSISSAKSTTIIQNWNTHFDGSSKGLRCEEFIYRIQCLTRENFDGDFEEVERNLHILLTGKARDWFWKYHKSQEVIEWNSFCAALRYEYKDYRTSFDIREELHNRKQKPNETFESFYDAINKILDLLTIPLHESEVIEIMSRNLRPEIRHELLYVEINSLAALKKLCLKREKLLNEDAFKRNIPSRIFPQRRIAAVEAEGVTDGSQGNLDCDLVEGVDLTVNAISKPEKLLKCWNCDEEGHYWDMCLKDRNIFCYGCGLKNVYKPQCTVCSKNLKPSRGSSQLYPLQRK